MQLLNEWGCYIVDMICFWVFKVWNIVEKYKKYIFILIIYGKVKYEEILVISLFVGIYLVVFDLEEVQYVVDYIFGNGD